MTQPQREYDDVEDWRLLQEVLEERDREWWAEVQDDLGDDSGDGRDEA